MAAPPSSAASARAIPTRCWPTSPSAASASSVEAVNVQRSNEEDDLILYQGGVYYDGGDRDGDADVFVANLFDENVSYEIRAASGEARVDDDQVFSDIGNGTTVGNFERLFVRTGNSDDFITGGDLNDRIDGAGGNDTLAGGLGDDRIDWGGGGDLIFYSGGSDVITGNSGIDTLEMGSLEAGYQRIAGFSSSTTIEFAININDLATSGDVQAEFATLYDTIGNTNRVLCGDLGSNFLRFSDVEKLVVSAQGSDDLLVSGEMGGILSGDGGDDVLAGRDGDDLLIGASGTDRYVFNGNWGQDVIAGEHEGSGEIFLLGWNRADIGFALDAGTLADANDLVVSNTNGDTIRFVDYFTGGANGLNCTFTFDDQSTTLDLTGLGATPRATSRSGIEVFAGRGRDVLAEGTDGVDAYFAGDGNDLIVGSDGADIMDGGIGTDAVAYEFSDTGVRVDLEVGFGRGGHADGDVLISIEDVLGSNHDDRLDGNDKRNAFAGGAGDDEIDGQGGKDFISGDAGDDTLRGGEGDDTIFGGEGDDFIDAGEGDDYVHADEGDDTVFARGGDDTVVGGDGDDTVDLGDGDDSYILLKDDGAPLASAGTDTVAGGTGEDTVELDSFGARAVVNLGGSFGGAQTVASNGQNDTTAAGAFASIASLTGFENVVGSGFDDTILGSSADNKLAGGSGDDLFIGYQGSDTFVGGAGFDRVSYAGEGGSQIVRVDLALGTATDSFGNVDTLSEIEHVLGSNTAPFDVLRGDAGDNRFTGNAGIEVDEIFGGAGIDTVDYGSESDTQNYLPGKTNPGGSGVGVVVDLGAAGTVSFPNAADTSGHGDVLDSIENVIGSIRGDEIRGDAGANLFVGSDGADILDGRGGVDTVDYGQEVALARALGLTQGIRIDDRTPGQNVDAFGDTDVLIDIERIVGTDADDTIVRFSDQRNILFGGDGVDQIALVANGTNAAVSGAQLYGQGGDDGLQGGEGDDILSGGTGDDTAIGGGGDDLYLYTDGTDSFDGAAGRDAVDFSFFGAAVIADLSATQFLTTDTLDAATGTQRAVGAVTSVESVTGGDFADALTGSAGDNRIEGGSGDDTIVGGDGSDTIAGGAGFDTLRFDASGTAGVRVDLSRGGRNATDGFGNAEQVTGIERLIGTAFSDTFTGGDADETFTGGDGVDDIDGGAGFDTIDLSQEGGTATADYVATLGLDGVVSGTFVDTVGNTDTFRNIEHFIAGNGDFDDITGSAADETFTGGAGVQVDFIDGGAGIDTVDYSVETGGGRVIVDLSVTGTIDVPNATDTFGHRDALIGFENVIGTALDDALNGGADANVLIGGDGDDLLVGKGGADTLIGGEGFDTVNYGAEGNVASITVDLRRKTAHATDTFGDTDTLIGIERIIGTSAADRMTGTDGDETLIGEGGADYLDGWTGDDVLDGGANDDTLLGWDGDDTLAGGTGDDELYGEDGDDTLTGGSGADFIDGGEGTDTADFSGNGSAGIDLSVADGSANTGSALGDRFRNIEVFALSDGNDTFAGDALDNEVAGGAGNDTLDGGRGADVLDGGAGFDTALYARAASGVTVSMVAGGLAGEAKGDVLTGIERLIGGTFGDVLGGDGGANVLNGAGGATCQSAVAVLTR